MRGRRRPVVVGLVGIAAGALALGACMSSPPPSGGGGTSSIAYPDLISVIPTSGFGISHPTPSTKELDYTHIVYNAGNGPLEVQPTNYDSTTNLATGIQKLYTYNSNGTRTLSKNVTAKDQFFFHIAHGHYHFPLATFGLYGVAPDGSVGNAVAVSPKNGFCLGDDVRLDSTLPHSPSSTGYSGSTCVDPNAVRGISSGWGDRYDKADPGQAIDITSVPDGTYWFHSVVDPDHNFSESNTTNNTTDIKLRISGDSVTPVSPLVSKGAFIFDQSALIDGVGTVSTAPMTTSAPNELLVAFVSAKGAGLPQTTTVSGGGLTWTLARRTNAQAGTAEVWTANAVNPLTNAVITSTPASGGLPQSLSVFAIQGAGGIGATAGASGAVGNPSVSLTTTHQGAWVMAVGNDPDRDVPHVSSLGRTMVHEWIDESGKDSTWLEAPNAPSVAGGTTVTFPHTYPASDHWDMTAIELLPLASSDTTPPIISGATLSNVAQDRATVSWTTDEPSTSRVDYGTTSSFGQSTATDASLVTQHTVELTGLTPSTHYFLQVVSADSQNNTATNGPITFTTTAPRTTPPVFSNIRLTDLEPDQAIIAWNTDEPTDTQVDYGPTNGYGSTSSHDATLTTAHFQLITNLSPSTIYHYRVDGADPYGNSGSSSDGSFQTPAIPPPITVDTTVFKDATGTATTASFATSGPGELLVAFVSSDGPSTGPQSATVTGAGLTWTLDQRTNSQFGTAEVWHAFASSTLLTASVTSTPAVAGFAQSLTVVAFKGAVGIGAKVGANQTSGAPSASLSTVSPNSMIYAVGVDWDQSVARTVASGQSIVHQQVNTTVGDTFWTQALNTTSGPVDSSVTMADTAPTGDRWNFSAVEIIRPISVPPPPASTPTISAVTATGITATGATITWTTNQIATSQVLYGLTGSYGSSTVAAPAGVTSHSQALTGLTHSTTYHYAVVSANGAGSVTSADFTFTTGP